MPSTTLLGARSPVPEQLRKLLGVRARAEIAPAPLLSRELDRVLIGDEIAPGLRYVEQWSPWPSAPEQIDLQGLGGDVIARHDLLAFDTETTGLAGGTGTRAFMIGAADWRDGGLRTRQLYLSSMAAESAMLREFAAWLHPRSVLVSYNGKSYDRPLLSTRYRLARLPDPVLGRAHVDLLHPVRRRYRGQWANCRLATVERQLLGVVREDDLPGSEAPRAWLDYLRGGSARDLRRVAAHNHQDLGSLAALLLKLSAS
nr:ribonuclease H-like domain-containing protein [Arenimonas oryziterrae]